MNQIVRKKLQLEIMAQHIVILCYRRWMDSRLSKRSKLNSQELIKLSFRQHKHIFRFMTLEQQLQGLQ